MPCSAPVSIPFPWHAKPTITPVHLCIKKALRLHLRKLPQSDLSTHNKRQTTMSTTPATKMLLKLRPTSLLTPRLQHIRHASSSIKPPRKPIVLEKPARFNPPSHAARLPRRAPRGAALPTYGRSEEEKESGRKRYPNMMPEEGTFSHWFLTSKGVHVWITMVSLFFPWSCSPGC